jgi:hypothetical protein
MAQGSSAAHEKYNRHQPHAFAAMPRTRRQRDPGHGVQSTIGCAQSSVCGLPDAGVFGTQTSPPWGCGCYPDRLPEDERTKAVIPDQFRHEIATAFNLKGRGLIILTVCGHRGVINAIKWPRLSAKFMQ